MQSVSESGFCHGDHAWCTTCRGRATSDPCDRINGLDKIDIAHVTAVLTGEGATSIFIEGYKHRTQVLGDLRLLLHLLLRFGFLCCVSK